MNRNLYVLLFCLAFCPAFPQQVYQKVVYETAYLLYLPEDYNQDGRMRFPLLVFLHGSGESGADLEKVKTAGIPKMIDQGRKFPFIIISPQTDGEWGWETEYLYRMLQHIKQTYRVDTTRIYLTGMSMGGAGTWELAVKHPEEFAAIAPVCGGRDTTNLFRLRNVPVWAFHGLQDEVALPHRTVEMINVLRRYNPGAQLTLYPDSNHNCWDTTYNNPALYEWLLQHRKFTYKEVSMMESSLGSYVGKYAARYDTVSLWQEGNHLVLKSRANQPLSLKAAGNNLFFIQPWLPIDIQFYKRGKNEFIVINRQLRSIYKKVKK